MVSAGLSAVLGSMGVRPASELGGSAASGGRVFDVPRELAALLPSGGLVAGSTVAVGGSASLLLALLSSATAEGSWAAVVGIPDLGMLAAAEFGVEVRRVAVVPDPGVAAPSVISALLDGMDLVAVSGDCLAGDGGGSTVMARRLSARARHTGGVLLSLGDWPGADIRIGCASSRWSGLGVGHGYLRGRQVRISVSGKGAAAREVTARMLLPGPAPGSGGAPFLECDPRDAEPVMAAG